MLGTIASFFSGASSEQTVTNYMGMQNFVPSHLTQLKMLITCWFLGEPTYYVPSGDNKKDAKQLARVHATQNLLVDELKKLYLIQEFCGNTTMNVFISVCNEALKENFEDVLKLAVQARNEYNMRSGPCAVLYYAAIHPGRKEFNEKNPLKFREYAKKIIKIPTDAWMLFELWKQNSGVAGKESKKKFPTILKKVLSDHLESMEKYQMKKYLNKSHIIDLIRICHPKPNKNELLNEVVKKGDLEVQDDEQTWETLRSQNKSWKEIVTQLGKVPHMALLRNLVGITKDTNDSAYLNEVIMPQLKAGVKYGKQFPFRYLTCYNEVEKLDTNYQTCRDILCNGLSDCIEIAMDNFPILNGNILCLSDNSGSALGGFTSEYGKMTMAEIGNLSSIMTARNCTGKGFVGVFGDNLNMHEIDKNVRVLDQFKKINDSGKTVGGGTENGVWIFFKQAFEEVTKLKNLNKEINKNNMTYWFDNIFFYSDAQIGHGGIYGRDPKEYKEYCINNGAHINALKLIQKYRELINPKANIYMVQIAGYSNSIIPEMLYRSHILTGWSGNETTYAKRMNDLMDQVESDGAC